MNLNKDYLLTVDIKQATVSVPNNMSFYITDIKTANIFAQLVVNESSSELIKKYAPIENAQDFYITLRVIKPNNQALSVDFNLLNQLEAFFMIDLTEEFRDYIGTYQCELFIDCMVNGELERITTSSFTYEVLPSIMNNLDEVIEGDPDYPLVEEMLVKMSEVTEAAEDAVTNANNKIDENITNTNSKVNEAITNANNKVDEVITNTNTRINENITNTNSKVDEAITNANSKIDQNIANVNKVAEDLETRIGDIETALDEILGGDQ